MLLRMLLISLAISLSGCFGVGAPEEPDYKICDPIFIFDEKGEVDWEASYIYCVDSKEPNNAKLEERYLIHEFLLGLRDKKLKPKMVKGSDYIKLIPYQDEFKKWAIEHCKN